MGHGEEDAPDAALRGERLQGPAQDDGVAPGATETDVNVTPRQADALGGGAKRLDERLFRGEAEREGDAGPAMAAAGSELAGREDRAEQARVGRAHLGLETRHVEEVDTETDDHGPSTTGVGGTRRGRGGGTCGGAVAARGGGESRVGPILPRVTSPFDGLHFAWTAALLAVVCAGWGLRLARAFDLPAAFVAPLGFAAFTAGAYGVFYAFVVGPSAGRVLACTWIVVSVAVLVAELRSGGGARRLRAREAWLPPALAVVLAASYLALLGAAAEPLHTRFTWELPPDNLIARVLADRLWAGEPVRPFLGDWTSSDRPPLQAALELALRPLRPESRREVDYQALATLAQISWLPAACALARTAGLGPAALAPALLAMAGSGFLLLNTVFTWSKLFAAAFFLTGLALVAASAGRRDRPRGLAVLVGGSFALALLGHGTIAFSMLALPAWPPAWRWARTWGRRGATMAALAAALLLGPWTLYQTFYDPPGHRLVKWHLAGVERVDPRGVGRAIRDAYAETPRRAMLETRRYNLRTIVLPPARMPGEPWDGWVRRSQFYHLGPMLGVLLAAILATAWCAARPGAPASTRAAGAWIVHAGATLAIWVGLMFLPGSTVIHQGSYVPVLLLLLACGPALAAWRPAAQASVLVVHLGVNVWAWVLTTPPAQVMGGATGPVSPAGASVALLLFAGFCGMLTLMPSNGRGTPRRDTTT